MTPKVVSFDCAQTLLDSTWRLDRYVMACCAHAGLSIGPEAARLYAHRFAERKTEYLRMNLSRDRNQERQFWRRLGQDWLREIGEDPTLVDSLHEASDVIGFGPQSILFRPYDDVRPCLNRLSSKGIRLIVISNWDVSLRRALRPFDLESPFEAIFASLEEGVEKPDPRLFHHACKLIGVEPAEVLHVGDNPVDDLDGARQAGMRAALIDRDASETAAPVLRSLDDLEEAFEWTL